VNVAIVDHVGIKAGMECYDISLYKALHKLGVQTLVYSNFESSEPGVFKWFRFKIGEDSFSFLQMLSKYRSLSHELSRRNVQYCILHGFRFGFAEWLLIRILKKPSLKFYMIVHDPESLIGTATNENWRRRIFGMCKRIIVHNRFSAREMFGQIKRSENFVSIIPHGHFIDTAVMKTDSSSFRKKNSLDEKKKYLLFFGHIKKTKGLDVLLNALALTDENICLVIAGRMRKHGFDYYRKIIEKHRLQNRIKLFPGYISPEMRNELFQMADAIVLPYRKVFQSGILLMSMSYGKPVIASDLLPNKEIITDNVNGFLFKTGCEQSLASTIETVFNDSDKREEVAARGKMFVETNNDWDMIASEWKKVFQL
jgi:D-inositol-3-phosphate glycosyltransferase